ncbi:hypothetical protein AB0L44_29675 [Nonomuraea wenchangensis]|uniref:hypothetical protein n=1 Tax=Nonomuraea wenchangensis TaxID=568860 RepID=UPI0034439C70
MIRKLSAVVLLTAGALAVAAAPATAATGRLVLHGESGRVVINPGPGCYGSGTPYSGVTNDTDTAVTAYSGSGCTGLSLVVQPGRSTTGEFRSVRVPS